MEVLNEFGLLLRDDNRDSLSNIINFRTISDNRMERALAKDLADWFTEFDHSHSLLNSPEKDHVFGLFIGIEFIRIFETLIAEVNAANYRSETREHDAFVSLQELKKQLTVKRKNYEREAN